MSGKESTYINDIVNSKLLLFSADFTENSYNYTAPVWHCPANLVEEEKAMKESSLVSRLLSFMAAQG